MATKECPYCDGTGLDDCPHCGTEIDCVECEGTGQVEVDDEEDE